MQFSRAILLAALLAAGSAHAAALKTNAAKSSIAATFKQMGVAVDVKFTQFRATIDFDPAKPDAAHAQVEVDVGSIDLGAPEYNSEVGKAEWFNKAKFPKATFVSSSIKTSGANQLQVSGKLSIKGKTTDVSFPLTVKKEGNAQMFDGALPIKRLAFNIGEGEWKDTGMVADEVTIKFHITAAP